MLHDFFRRRAQIKCRDHRLQGDPRAPHTDDPIGITLKRQRLLFNGKEAVDSYLNGRAQVAADVRRQNELRSDPQGIRERLSARRSRPA